MLSAAKIRFHHGVPPMGTTIEFQEPIILWRTLTEKCANIAQRVERETSGEIDTLIDRDLASREFVRSVPKEQ